MRRLSIRKMMSLVVFAALAMVALRGIDKQSAGPLLALAAGAVWLNVVRAVRGEDRAWCIGYAVFSGGYLILAFAPIISSWVAPSLPTTLLMEFGYARSVGPPPRVTEQQMKAYNEASAQFLRHRAEASPPVGKEFDAMMDVLKTVGNLIRRVEGHESFRGSGHALVALFAGIMGGNVGFRIRRSVIAANQVEF
jgi:hypothetical protein